MTRGASFHRRKAWHRLEGDPGCHWSPDFQTRGDSAAPYLHKEVAGFRCRGLVRSRRSGCRVIQVHCMKCLLYGAGGQPLCAQEPYANFPPHVPPSAVPNASPAFQGDQGYNLTLCDLIIRREAVYP